MMFGPILIREWLVAPRRARFYVQRVVFVLALFSLVCTAWALMAGIQQVRNIGDLSRFGALVFQIVVPLELIVTMFLAAITAAGSISHEKDKRTLILLLLTRLTNFQIVIGKLAASLVTIFWLILAALPLLLLIALMGGVTDAQVGMATAVIVVASWWCGALANMVAFWREKTFQTLAITVLTIAGWLVACEAIAADTIPGIEAGWATVLSPIRALWSVCMPITSTAALPIGLSPALAHCVLGAAVAVLLSGITVARLRVWNPSREIRPKAPDQDEDYALASEPLPGAVEAAEANREQSRGWKVRAPRKMWNNPVLWREVRTWAYGRKLLFIHLIYLALFAAAMVAIYWSVSTGVALERSRLADELIPVTARILAPFFVVSLVIINALAVNSITNERDGQALDLLLATQLTPPQFLFGKLLGVLYVTKEMVLLPIVLCIYLWWQGGVSGENLAFVIGGLVVMDIFAAMLGIHCGMIYSQSRHAIGTSLGTLFFLFLGIATCMMIMMSFRGSFARQLPPFLAIILGGGTGLYVAMGSRNPSPAIALSAFGLPFLTFFAITSFILRNQELTVFSVVVVAYGFATLAMMIPALSEFDIAMGKSRSVDED
ncbi:MAG: ABC transporter permease [Planctomycetota bacterium]|nr:MAG: ABC transporter permease [Planctomycetota bacterium]